MTLEKWIKNTFQTKDVTQNFTNTQRKPNRYVVENTTEFGLSAGNAINKISVVLLSRYLNSCHKLELVHKLSPFT